MDCSLPGSSVHGILQVRTLEWVAISSPGDPPHPGIEPTSLRSPALAGGFFTSSTTWEAVRCEQKASAEDGEPVAEVPGGFHTHFQGSLVFEGRALYPSV